MAAENGQKLLLSTQKLVFLQGSKVICVPGFVTTRVRVLSWLFNLDSYRQDISKGIIGASLSEPHTSELVAKISVYRYLDMMVRPTVLFQ